MGLLSRAADKSPLEKEIAQYHETNAAFHCLVFESSGSAGDDDKTGSHKKFSDMINIAGSVIPLPLNRSLILLPIAKDRELIAHRISKSLKTTQLLSFEADSPENALNKIRPLL